MPTSLAILGYFSDSNHGDGDYQGDVLTPNIRNDAAFAVGTGTWRRRGPYLSEYWRQLGRPGRELGQRLTAADASAFDVDLTASEAGGVLTVTGDHVEREWSPISILPAA